MIMTEKEESMILRKERWSRQQQQRRRRRRRRRQGGDDDGGILTLAASVVMTGTLVMTTALLILRGEYVVSAMPPVVVTERSSSVSSSSSSSLRPSEGQQQKAEQDESHPAVATMTTDRKLNWLEYFYGGIKNNNNPSSRPTSRPTLKNNGGSTFKPTNSPIRPLSGTTTSSTAATTTTTTTSSSSGSTYYCYPNMYELSCQCDTTPEPWMIKPANIHTWTFQSVVACCDAMKFECAGPTTTTTTTTTSTTSATDTTTTTTTTTTHHGLTYCYPNMYNLTCVCDTHPEPWMILPVNVNNWTFDNTQECCTAMEFACAPPSPPPPPSPVTTTTTTTSSTAIGPTTTKPTSTLLCNDPNGLGKAYWYPWIYDGKKQCVYDALYPTEYYTTLHYCNVMLFPTKEECCADFPDACDGIAGPQAKKWYPDFTNANISTKTVPCIYNDEYPSYMTQPALISSHLFDTETACCDAYPCSTKTNVEYYWFPVIDYANGVVHCEYGNHYPPVMLEYPESQLFVNKTECDTFFRLETSPTTNSPTSRSPTRRPTRKPTTHRPISIRPTISTNGTTTSSTTTTTTTTTAATIPSTINPTQSYWYPGSDLSHCTFGVVTDPNMLKNPSMYIFSSLCDCCNKHDCEGMNLGNHCTGASVTTTTTTSTTAATIPSTINPTQSYWYPGSDLSHCTFGVVTDPNMLKNPSMYIFSSLCDCCNKHDCEGMNLGNHCTASVTTTTTSSTILATGVTTTTTGATTTVPTLQKRWYPKLNSDATKYTSCVYGSDFPKFYNVSTHTFDTLEKCCLAYEEACTVCNDPNGAGKAYWYPHVINGEKQCIYDALYPPIYFTDLAYCNVMLFATKEECCLEFPEGCSSSNNGPKTKKWYPDMVNANQELKIVECIFDSNYPDYMILPDIASSHLFETEAECCKLYPCGNKMIEYWFPVINANPPSIACEFGNHYPLHMLEYPENHLYTERTQCEAFYGITSAPTKSPVGVVILPPNPVDPTKSYWYPGSDLSHCTFGVVTDPNMLKNPSMYLFSNLCDCCNMHDCEGMNLGNHCSSSVTTTTTTSSTIMSGSTSSTPTINPAQSYWYPGAGLSHCTFGIVTDPNMLKNPSMYLFSSLCDCCNKHDCEDMSLGGHCDSSVTTTTTTTAATTLATTINPSQSYWYPELRDEINACFYGVVKDSFLLQHSSFYLFSTMCECCAKHSCSDMNLGNYCPSTGTLTTTTSTSVATTTTAIGPTTTTTLATTINPTQSYWYPGSDYSYCVFGVVTDQNMLKNPSMYMFSSLCGCCNKHDCEKMNLGDSCSSSATTTTTTSTSAVGTTTKATASTATSTTKSGSTFIEYWFPVISADKQTLTCEFGTHYPQVMLQHPENQLFLSKSECEDFFAVSHSPTKTPVSAPVTSTSTTSTTTSTAVTTTTTTSGKPVFAYPDILNGFPGCLYDNQYPSFMTVGNNPKIYLFSSTKECCQAFGYRCTITVEETKAPTTAPTAPLLPYWYSDIHANGNVCVYGKNYEWWMATDAYRTTQLFNTMEECCREHHCDVNGTPQEGPNDVVTFLKESFESGMSAVPWIHGGTAMHMANWYVTDEKHLSGQYSLRSGDLNNMRGKSSDIRLKVDSSRGAQLKYSYYSDVGGPFDFFELKVRKGDGELIDIEKVGSPTNGWLEHSTYLPPGPHEILFRVIAPPATPDVKRSDNLAIFGTGVVYIDNLELRPL